MMAVNQLKRRNLETKTLKREEESLKAHYNELLREKERLSKEVEHKRTVVAAANEVIEQRLALLGKLFTGVITSDGRIEQEAVSEIEAFVEDRETFVRTVRTVLDAIRPGFIIHLKECGLTEGQISCCCLYAIGLRGKDIANYLNTSTMKFDGDWKVVDENMQETTFKFGEWNTIMVDMESNKATYPAVYSLEGAKAKADEYMEKAMAHLDIFKERADILRDIAKFITERNS